LTSKDSFIPEAAEISHNLSLFVVDRRDHSFFFLSPLWSVGAVREKDAHLILE